MVRLALAGAALLLSGLALRAQDDPKEIIRRSVERDQTNFARARDYTYLERIARQDLDGRNRAKESETFDVTIIEGRPYRRQTEKNDKPLSPEESRKAQEKFDKTLRERQSESPSQRARREEEAEKRRRESRDFLKELPEAFDFHLRGQEKVDGHEAWVIEAEPRPGYQPRASRAGILKKFRGTLWIDKATYAWVRVEAETIDTVSFGLLLARIAKGTRMEFGQKRVNNEVWLPDRIHVRMDARLALLKHYNQDLEITFRNYRKFQTDSRIVPADGTPQ